MIEIAYLTDHPEHIHTVAEWIYDRWIDTDKLYFAIIKK